jgi:hypothetical protein
MLQRFGWEVLIQYIRSYPPYLEAVSSIRNLRTRQALVTRDTPGMENKCHKDMMMVMTDTQHAALNNTNSKQSFSTYNSELPFRYFGRSKEPSILQAQEYIAI